MNCKLDTCLTFVQVKKLNINRIPEALSMFLLKQNPFPPPSQYKYTEFYGIQFLHIYQIVLLNCTLLNNVVSFYLFFEEIGRAHV